MKSLLKKTISIITALALAASFAAVTGAAETDVVISDCSDTAEWTVSAGNGVEVDQTGYNSNTAIRCQVNYGKFSGKTLNFGPLDGSDYTSVEWDAMFYTQRANGAEGTMWEQIVDAYGTSGKNNMFLRLYSANGANRVYFLSRMNTEVSASDSNWVHFSVDIDDFNTENGEFDPAQITGFYFTTCDGDYDETVDNGFIRLDNIIMTGYVPDPSENIVLSECETTDGWSYEGSGGVGTSAAGRDGSSLYFNTSYGVLRPLSFTADEPVDVSGYTALEFDITVLNSNTITDQFAYIMESYTDYLAVEISDGTDTYTYDIMDLQITETDGGWYHISLSLDGISNIASVRLYTLDAGLGVPDTSVSNTIYKLDNFIVTKAEVSPNGYDYARLSDMLLNDASSLDGWSYEGSAVNMMLNANGYSGSAVQIFAGYGKVVPVTLTFDEALNISRHTEISWNLRFLRAGTADDVWGDIRENYAGYIAAVIRDENGASHSYSLSDMKVEALENGWYRFSVELSEASGVDLSSLSSFSFRLTDGSFTAEQLGYNINLRIDDIYARYEAVTVTLGDINGDGAVDLRDLVRLKKYIADNGTDAVVAAADLNNDSEINSADMICLERYLLGEISDFEELWGYSELSMENYSPVVKP